MCKMPRTIDPIRSRKAIELVSRGVPMQRAMVQAGYGKQYSFNIGNGSKILEDLKKAKKTFSYGFMKGMELEGLTGMEAGKRVGQIALKGKDRDSVQAIGLAMKHMFVLEENVSKVALGIFIVPPTVTKEEWNEKFGKKVVDTSTQTNESEKI